MSRVITHDRQNPADHAQILVQDHHGGGDCELIAVLVLSVMVRVILGEV